MNTPLDNVIPFPLGLDTIIRQPGNVVELGWITSDVGLSIQCPDEETARALTDHLTKKWEQPYCEMDLSMLYLPGEPQPFNQV